FPVYICLVFIKVTARLAIYTLSLHDALPIYKPTGITACRSWPVCALHTAPRTLGKATQIYTNLAFDCQPSLARNNFGHRHLRTEDRKSTRLNSSHSQS